MQSDSYDIIYPVGSSSNVIHTIHGEDLTEEFLIRLSPCDLKPVALFDEATGFTKPLNGNNLKYGRYVVIYEGSVPQYKREKIVKQCDIDETNQEQKALIKILRNAISDTCENSLASKHTKLLVVGEIGCGKTNLLKRRVFNVFSAHYRSTVGVDFVFYPTITKFPIVCRDIAGRERFGNMTEVYYKDAEIALVLFDISRELTFGSCLKWKADIDSKIKLSNGEKIPCILVACKSDLEPEVSIEKDSMNQYCEKYGFVDWCYTSSLNGTGFDELDRLLIKYILN
jgi:small GTP-binding protein